VSFRGKYALPSKRHVQSEAEAKLVLILLALNCPGVVSVFEGTARLELASQSSGLFILRAPATEVIGFMETLQGAFTQLELALRLADSGKFQVEPDPRLIRDELKQKQPSNAVFPWEIEWRV
jgi:hypothetical protein